MNQIESAYAIEGHESHRKTIEYICSQLREGGLIVEQDVEATKSTAGQLVYTISCSPRKLKAMAEMLGQLKQTTDGLMEPYTLDEGALMEYSFVNSDSKDFFVSSEQMHLLWSLIRRVTITEDLKDILPNSSIPIVPGDELLAFAHRAHIITEIIPLHSARRWDIWKQVFWSSPFNSKSIDLIFEYYGSKVAIYYAWMDHFTRWLFVPATFGSIVWVANFYASDATTDKSLLAPLFSIFMIIWAAFFLQFWKRECARLVCKWGISGCDDADLVRAEFRGELRPSIITGRPERYFAHRYRVLRYCGSALVTGAMLFIAFGVMVLSLNFQGYIHENSVGATYLHFPFIHQFSLPGAIFDQQGGGPLPLILPWVPCLVHTSVILMLNTRYREIAISLNDWENHRLEQSYEDALIIKRFLFEAFDCYIALFYLAFCQMDLILLQSELVSLYTIDSIRRIATESLLPLLLQMAASRSEQKELAKKKKDDDSKAPAVSEICKQFRQDEYEQFDDYMEMVIEFGYVTLFASAFPLAAALSIVCNIIEMKSDFFKLSYVVRRPFATRAESMGTWLSVLTALIWLSVLTNVFIFGFTTEQMMQFVPDMFDIEESDDDQFGGSDHIHVMRKGMGRYVIGFVFFAEHILFLLIQLIFIAVPSTPPKVQDELKRRELQRERQIERKFLTANPKLLSRHSSPADSN